MGVSLNNKRRKEMNATVSRDNSKGGAPMFSAGEQVSNSVIQLMNAYGIQTLTCKMVSSANFNRIIGEAVYVSGIPQEIVEAGVLVKDLLAQLLSSVGVFKIEIQLESDEVVKLLESYKNMVQIGKETEAKLRAETEGSGKAPDPTPADTAGSSETKPEPKVEVKDDPAILPVNESIARIKTKKVKTCTGEGACGGKCTCGKKS